MIRSIPFLFFLTMLSGCMSDEGPVSFPTILLPPSLEGRWIGTSPGFLNLDAQLKQTRNEISGSGTISGVGPTLTVTLQGKVRYPQVSMSINIPGYLPFVMTGKCVGKDDIEAVLNGSGASNLPITLVRQ